MSARVLNPMLMTEMSRGLTGGRVVPTKAELAPVRRDLFGPVDHAAARALAERELRAQSRLDTERWGFDFQLELPRCDARYAWEVVSPTDVVPEPYALRGMGYLRKHAPGTPRKLTNHSSPKLLRANTRSAIALAKEQQILQDEETSRNKDTVTEVRDDEILTPRKAEMTPPQEHRVPDIVGTRNGETTPEEVPRETIRDAISLKQTIEEPTTPILPHSARKQSTITDYMKSRKRSLKGSPKRSIVEPPEKMSRNAGQIRS